MKNVLIDTNIYSYAMRGDSETVSVLQLDEFLDATRVQICYIDEDTAEFYAEILNNLREKGTPIPTNDIWIAAAAFQHSMRLFSKDQHFILFSRKFNNEVI